MYPAVADTVRLFWGNTACILNIRRVGKGATPARALLPRSAAGCGAVLVRERAPAPVHTRDVHLVEKVAGVIDELHLHHLVADGRRQEALPGQVEDAARDRLADRALPTRLPALRLPDAQAASVWLTILEPVPATK